MKQERKTDREKKQKKKTKPAETITNFCLEKNVNSVANRAIHLLFRKAVWRFI